MADDVETRGSDGPTLVPGRAEAAHPTERYATEIAGAGARDPVEGADSATRIGSGPVRPAAPAPGDLGRYQVVEELGRGGMGVVYRAHDRTLDRDVALKVLQVVGRVDAETLGRFQREARAAAALDHPSIVRVHDVGVLPDGAPYFTMELLAGQDLAHAIADARISPREAVEAVRQVALALVYAHQKGVLHRDIKPQNIWLRRTADAPVHALLLDFGLAKLAEGDLASHADGTEARKSIQSLTRSGEIFGTPAYMPPEQTHGAKDVDARADIYSLGAALYDALAGKAPFDAPSLADLLERVQRQDPSPPSRFSADVDADLDTIVLKCLQKDPKDRYQDAGGLAEDLKRWLAGDPISARPIGLAGRVWRRARRNKAVAIPLAGLLLAAVAAVAWLGGGAVLDRVRLARWDREARGHLDARRYAEAETPARKATELAPADRRYADLLARALAGQAAERGVASLALYRKHRDRLAALQSARKEAEGREKEAPLGKRQEAKDARWAIEKDLRLAETGRADAWADAVVKFTQAVTLHQAQDEARAGLTELYWDRYLQAEGGRDRVAEATYGPLVSEFGGDEYAAKVRCEQEVRIRFLLPAGHVGDHVDARLYEYRLKEAPPVLVPVPFDLARGQIDDGAPELARDPGFGRPVSLAEATGGSSRKAAVREGSVYSLRRADENRLSLPVARDAEGRPCVQFRGAFAKGSYLLHIAPGEGLCEARYPFVVARDIHWDETCEVPSSGDAPPLPPGLSVGGPYWMYVPPGPYRAGGDPLSQQNSPRDAAIIRVPGEGARGFFVSRFEVTCPMYLEYLNDRAWHGRCSPSCGDWGHVPRQAREPKAETVYWPRDPSGRFSLPQGWEEWPVIAIAWGDAQGYCTWLTDRMAGGDDASANPALTDAAAWRFSLPDEDEWEKAARGPDGRSYPWGDEFDSSFCSMVDSRQGEQETRNPEPLGLFPMDESPYGIRDMAGGAQENITGTTGVGGRWNIVKGGALGAGPPLCRAASRLYSDPVDIYGTHGIRLVAHRAPR